VSIGAQTAVAFGRALLIAVLAIAVAGTLSGWLAAQRGRAQTLAWTLLLVPFFTPPLLISYAFSKFALALVVSPWSHEALYLGVLALKLIPVAVIVRALVPTPLSAEARHAYHSLARPSWRERVRFHLRGAGAGPWVAGGLVFVLAFADFELASLWSVRTWTVAIFDAQIGGLALSETMRLAAWPLGVELAVLAWIASRGTGLPVARFDDRNRGDRWPWFYLGVSAAFVSLTPLAVVTTQALAGLPTLAKNFVLGPEIGASMFFALGAALAADTLARLARRHGTATLLLGAPGLLGALVVSLLILTLFQTPPLRAAYDTPLPLALAQTLLLLPLALLLDALWPRHTPALHIAKQVGSSRLVWELETRPRMTALGLLFCWAYFDFTASSILAPVGFTPIFVRLHNLAHYGQTAVLSAMMLAAFATPVAVLLLTGATLRLYARRHGR